VLWGYTCSSTAQMLNETYPQIIKFYVQCELQVTFILLFGFSPNASWKRL
jgi:hypothetical protein